MVRKRLGCRRSLDDMLSKSEEEKMNQGDNVVDTIVLESDKKNKEDTERLSQGRPSRRPKGHLVFTSPRINTPDQDFFPSNHLLYMEPNQRWRLISDQAGSHKQDGTVMMIGRRITPRALKIGLLKHAAVRVQSLNLFLDHTKDDLPEWLDVITEIFFNLEHLTITDDVFPGDELMVSARMRRLYVLSRLPNLKSIDNILVTLAEQNMAVPRRLQRKKVGLSRTNPVSGDDIGIELLTKKFEDMNQTIPESLKSSNNLDTTKTVSSEISYDGGAYFEKFEKIFDDEQQKRIAPENMNCSHNQIGERKQQGNIDRNDSSISPIANRYQVGANNNNSDILRSRVRTFHNDSSDDIEFVSVASTDYEWSAACGILTFRNDRTCAPRIRLPFCNRKVRNNPLASDLSATIPLNSVDSLRTKERQNKEPLLMSCTPVQRESKMTRSMISQNECCESPSKELSSSTFFSSEGTTTCRVMSRDNNISANKHLSPFKTLTSPFPMQFRGPQHKSAAMREIPTSEGNLPIDYDLPDTCPSSKIRRHGTIVHTLKQKSSQRELSRFEGSKENARSNSIMDYVDEGNDDYLSDDELRISVTNSTDDELRIS